MANNYLQFSMTFNLNNKEEEDFLQKCLSIPDFGNEQSVKKWSEETGIDVSNVEEFELECWPDFEHEIESGEAWFYAREYGNTANVIHILQAFLTKFPRKKGIGFTYAETCDKMRPDEFHGGACWVSGDGSLSESMHTSQFYSECEGDKKV